MNKESQMFGFGSNLHHHHRHDRDHHHQDHEQRFSARALQALARKKARYHPYHSHFIVSRGPAKKFEDLDYRYKRSNPKDYALNLNPSIPYYADYVYPPGWNIEPNPTVPTPDITIVDPEKDKDKENENENENNQDTTISKEDWEAKFKLEDGTYNMSVDALGGDFMQYVNINSQKLPDFLWNWFQNYMTFEKNYPFPNQYFDRDTPFYLEEFNDTSTSNIYVQFYFTSNASGLNSYYQIPITKYSLQIPVPVPDPSNPTGEPPIDTNTNTDENQTSSNQNLMSQSYNVSDTNLTDEVWVKKYSDDDGTMFMPVDPNDPSKAFDTGLNNSYQTAWLYDYFTKVLHKDPNSEYMSVLRTEGNYWMFSNRTDSNGNVVSDVIIYDTSRKSPTGSDYAISYPLNASLLNFNESKQWWDPEHRTREQRYNVDKGLWSAQYMDPTNGKFWMPLKLLDTPEEFYNWLNDYFRFFDTTRTPFVYGKDHILEISFEPGIYRIYYKSGNAKKQNIVIPRSENPTQ